MTGWLVFSHNAPLRWTRASTPVRRQAQPYRFYQRVKHGCRSHERAVLEIGDEQIALTNDCSLLPMVLGTGWFAAGAANVKQGFTTVLVGDGAVDLRAYCQPNRWARNASSRRVGTTNISSSRASLARRTT